MFIESLSSSQFCGTRSQLINSDNYIFIGGVLTGYANPVMHMRTDAIRELAIYMRGRKLALSWPGKSYVHKTLNLENN